MTTIEEKIDLILEGINLLMIDDKTVFNYFSKRREKINKKEKIKEEPCCEIPPSEEKFAKSKDEVNEE